MKYHSKVYIKFYYTTVGGYCIGGCLCEQEMLQNVNKHELKAVLVLSIQALNSKISFFNDLLW